MALEIPELDTSSYELLLNHMVESIPKHTRLWTDFNYSDPGITLLQLLCWIAESLLYRSNYIPIETYICFLQLWAGAAGNEVDRLLIELQKEGLDPNYVNLLLFLKNLDPKNITAEKIQTEVLQFFEAPYLAVTADDYAILTLEANCLLEQQGVSDRIARAIVLNDSESVTVICVAAETTSYSQPAYPNQRFQSTIAVSQSTTIAESDQYNYDNIIAAVNEYLAPRLLLGTITYVEPPIFTPVNIEMTILCNALADANEISQTASERILEFLSPYIGGGPDQQGWPYNQAPTYYDISQVVLTIPGVSYIEALSINFYPTMKLNVMATLNVDAILGSAPIGMTVPQFVGLAQSQVLNIVVKNAN